MRKGYKLLLIASVVLLIIMAVLLSITLMNFRAIEKWDLFANVTVTNDKGGFELNKNSTDLTFGKVKLGGASTRFIDFTNSYEFPVVLKMSAEGTIAPLLHLEDIRFEKNEMKRISISVATTNETELGYYSGYVRFRLLVAAE